MTLMKFTRDENLEFIETNGDKINLIHSDENEAYNLLKRINLEYLGKGVIVAGELIKQKILSDPMIKGILYDLKVRFTKPLVIDKEVYVDCNIEEIIPPFGRRESETYHYKFSVRKEGLDIMEGEAVLHGHLFWSLDSKKPAPLEGSIFCMNNIIAPENMPEKFYRNEQYGGNILKASSFIPPKMIGPIKDSVNELLGEDSERQYMLNSQHIIAYRKTADLTAPLSFYFTKPHTRKRKEGTYGSTKLQINSKNECILECLIMGSAI